MVRYETPEGYTIEVKDTERKILIVNAGKDECPYYANSDLPKWEQDVWLRCMAKKSVLLTNVGEPE